MPTARKTTILKPSRASRVRAPKRTIRPASEPELWAVLDPIARNAIAFWQAFMQLRKGQTVVLELQDIEHLVLIVRAVCWVESRHGSGAGNHPDRDPMQCGNPLDAWWPQLAGNSPAYDRFVGGPGAPNYNANELPAAAAAFGAPPPPGQLRLPAEANLSALGDIKKGHKNTQFGPNMSLYWGVPHLIWKTNCPARGGQPGRPFYSFGTLSRSELLEGAVAYNGQGDPNYRKKVSDALTAAGWPVALESAATSSEDEAVAHQRPFRQLHRGSAVSGGLLAARLNQLTGVPPAAAGLQLIDFRSYPAGSVISSPFLIAGFEFLSLSGQSLDIRAEGGDQGLAFSELRVTLRAPVDNLIVEVGGFASEVLLTLFDGWGSVLRQLQVSPSGQLHRLFLTGPGVQILEFTRANGEGLLVELIVPC